jgi:hypothetical protein
VTAADAVGSSRLSWQRIVLLVLATIGGVLLAVAIGTFWMYPNDALAYWLAAERLVAGLPVYVQGDAAFEPYAYHYTPPLAQVLAPFTLVFSTMAYLIAYRVLNLLALWELAGRRFLWMLALIAFLPVAIELNFENVHLFMALSIVWGLLRWPWLFSIAAIVKLSPGLGLVYLAVQRRWRDVAIASFVGVAVVGVSYVIDPALWAAWFDSVVNRLGVTGNSLLPVPYVVRAAAGLALTVVGALIGARRGELLLVAAITLANPNLSMNGLAVLAAAVPIWMAGPGGLEGRRTRAAEPERDAEPGRAAEPELADG